ncbi:MAG: orotate phosphoribosyltransferase [Candidatus Omnitrophica bacterium]|nr:orotate phosphoribosyltransferase [Candidatus Omnitrophota bacterium]MBU4478899.1 orotate phosphoribosyltransferase [Candidatus Omnitrophota bacterium]
MDKLKNKTNLFQKNKSRLLEILKQHSFKRKHVILAGGKPSSYYLDVRLSSLHAEGAYLIASTILEMIKHDKIDAIGGLTLGADPIIGAAVALSGKIKKPLNGFIVRKEEKKHGMRKLIEGPEPKKTSRVVIIDDVVTTGSSTIQALKAVQSIGCKIVRVIAVVDRLEGARENIKKLNCDLESIFTIKDFHK